MQLASSKDDNDFNVQVKYIILGQKTTAAVWVHATNIVRLTYDNSGSYYLYTLWSGDQLRFRLERNICVCAVLKDQNCATITFKLFIILPIPKIIHIKIRRIVV